MKTLAPGCRYYKGLHAERPRSKLREMKQPPPDTGFCDRRLRFNGNDADFHSRRGVPFLLLIVKCCLKNRANLSITRRSTYVYTYLCFLMLFLTQLYNILYIRSRICFKSCESEVG